MKSQPPFISTQRIWRLDCPPGFQEACLHPQSLWTLPLDMDQSGVRPIDIVGLPRGACCWKLINPPRTEQEQPWLAAQQRSRFLADMSIPRLCVTIDAGVGKTTALRQMQFLRQTGANSGCLAVLLDFAELPTSVDVILGSSDKQADDPEQTPLLVRKLKNNPALRDLPGSQLRALIERSIRRDQFSLIVDSLDQSAELGEPWPFLRARTLSAVFTIPFRSLKRPRQ
jgi:hypothetical protein